MKNNRDQVQDNLLNEIPPTPHGLVQLAPRVGKSKILINLGKREDYSSILWVTSSVKLRDEDIPAEFQKWDADELWNRTEVIHYDSLHKARGKYGVIYLDEYQHLTEAGAVPLLNGDLTADAIVGFSGTHPKGWDKQAVLDKLNLKPLVTLGIDEAVDKKLIADYSIKIVEVPMNGKDRNIKAGNKEKPFYQTEVAAYEYASSQVTNNPGNKMKALNRMRRIYDSPSKEQAALDLLRLLPGRKLIFCSSIAQAERMTFQTYHSKTNDVFLKQFLAQEIDLLACVNAGGTGFTYHNVDHFILVQANSDGNGETTQKFARSLLLQEGYKAVVWIIKLAGTQDAVWIDSFLKNYNSEKVELLTLNHFKDNHELYAI